MKKKFLQILISINILILSSCNSATNNQKSKNNKSNISISDEIEAPKYKSYSVDISQKIDSLKKEVFVKNLNRLHINPHHNLIKYIDKSIGSCHEISILEIGLLKMSVLPKEFEQLEELFQLDIYVENCDKVNFDMIKLNNLSAITLYFNKNNNYDCFINELPKLKKRLSIRLHMEKDIEKNTITSLSKMKNINVIEIHNRQFGIHDQFIKNTFKNIQNIKVKTTGFGFEIIYPK